MHAENRSGGLPDEVATAAADALRLLADSTRIKLLWVLMQEEAHVGALAERTGANPPAVSQHLAKLRAAGMVAVRREGTYAYYRACDEHISRILVDLLDHTREELGEQERVRRASRRKPRRAPVPGRSRGA